MALSAVRAYWNEPIIPYFYKGLFPITGDVSQASYKKCIEEHFKSSLVKLRKQKSEIDKLKDRLYDEGMSYRNQLERLLSQLHAMEKSHDKLLAENRVLKRRNHGAKGATTKRARAC